MLHPGKQCQHALLFRGTVLLLDHEDRGTFTVSMSSVMSKHMVLQNKQSQKLETDLYRSAINHSIALILNHQDDCFTLQCANEMAQK